MRKIDVNICVGNCSHQNDSWSIITFFNSLSSNTKDKISLNYDSCRNCGKGPRVRVGNILIEKANPEKVRRALLQKGIPVDGKKRCVSY